MSRLNPQAAGIMGTKSVLLDVSGVIGDVRGTYSWKIKVALEESGLDRIYGIGFIEMARAYSTGGFDPVFVSHNVPSEVIRHYHQVWRSIQEYPAGNVRIYHDSHTMLNSLEGHGLQVAFLTRLTTENVINVLRELQRRGYTGCVDILEDGTEAKIGPKNAIHVFNPRDDNERSDDDQFVAGVIKRALDETAPPRVYVGDELERGPVLRYMDSEIQVIGSTRGFFSRKEMESTYYKHDPDSELLDFESFQTSEAADEQGYTRKVFDRVITDFDDLVHVCCDGDGG